MRYKPDSSPSFGLGGVGDLGGHVAVVVVVSRQQVPRVLQR